MKRLGNIYNKFLNIETIKKSVLKTSRGRRKQPKIKMAIEHLDDFSEKVRIRLEEHKYDLGKIIETDILEGSRDKPRHIAYLDSFLSQSMIAVTFDSLSSYLTNHSYSNSYGAVPGRGPHKAKLFIERWLKTDRVHTKYICIADIKHCFQNVSHKSIKEAYKQMFKDKDLIDWFDAILDCYCEKEIENEKYGIPIGFLSSPWFIHILLTPLDFIIKQKFQIKHYIRFMDDFILFDNNKRKIKKAVEFINEYLKKTGMWLKPNWEVKLTDKAPFDYIGFKFYRDHTEVRTAIAKKIKISAKGIRHKYSPQLYEARKILSYNGWLIHTSSYNFFKRYVEPHICVKAAKHVVSKASKIQYRELKNANNHNLFITQTS